MRSAAAFGSVRWRAPLFVLVVGLHAVAVSFLSRHVEPFVLAPQFAIEVTLTAAPAPLVEAPAEEAEPEVERALAAPEPAAALLAEAMPEVMPEPTPDPVPDRSAASAEVVSAHAAVEETPSVAVTAVAPPPPARPTGPPDKRRDTKPIAKPVAKPGPKLVSGPVAPPRPAGRPVAKPEGLKPEKAGRLAALPTVRSSQVAASSAQSTAGYGAALMAAIHRRVSFPAEARDRGGGLVRVAFVIGPGGRVESASVTSSSGVPALDQAALAAVRGVSAPPPPNGRFVGVAPIRFRLQ